MTILAARKPFADKNQVGKIYTLEEYLCREEAALSKSEFYNGKIIPMAGAKVKHNLIASNILSVLKVKVRTLATKFITLNSDQKIYIPNIEVAVYPDALVIAEKPEYWNGRADMITNPILIVEVLSKSTRGYDRGEKFVHYRTILSFKEYVLIEQDKQQVEVWFRSKENTWEINTFVGQDADIFLNSIGVTISMSDIYENIDLL